MQSDEEALKIREQEVSQREKASERLLEYHLKNQRLLQREINQIRAPNAVF